MHSLPVTSNHISCLLDMVYYMYLITCISVVICTLYISCLVMDTVFRVHFLVL